MSGRFNLPELVWRRRLILELIGLPVGQKRRLAGGCLWQNDPFARRSFRGRRPLATLASACDREDRILDHLRQRFEHVLAERALSGDGLENIYQAIAAIEGINATPCTVAEITRNALNGGSPPAVAALETFCALLGSFAGSVALTFGARGGVYIAGGIASRIVDFLARSEFRRRFEAKGRFQSYLGSVPTNVIVHPAATFVGLISLVQRRPDPWT